MTVRPHPPDNAESSDSDTPPVPDTTVSPLRQKDWLTTAEVSREYHISVGTLRYWRHIGYGPACFTLGRRKVVYRRTDLDAWIAEQEQRTRRGGTTAA